MAAIPFIKMLFSLPGLIAVLVVLGFIIHLAGYSITFVLLSSLFIGLVLFIGRKMFMG